MPQSDAGVDRFDARCPVNQEVGKVTIGYPRDAVCATTKQARLKALFGYCMRLCLVVGLCNHEAFAAEPVDAAAWISGDSSYYSVDGKSMSTTSGMAGVGGAMG